MNEQEFVKNPSPLLTTGFFSKITFRYTTVGFSFLKMYFIFFLLISWINPLLSLGRKKQLQLSDLYSPVTDDEAEKLTNDLEKYQ